MQYLALLLILAALVLLIQAARRQKKSGLPGGRIIYADTRRWGPVEKPLYDPVHGITGKPDYLIEQGDQLIPVEVKSSNISQAPYDSHIFQLAAYCMLVQNVLGKRPPYGILHYNNRTFEIDYTPQLEAALLELMDNMREKGDLKDVARSHESPARCSRCGYRSICDQKLK